MSLPDTREKMLRAKYKLLGTSPCRRCNARIEWWETTNGHKVPFDLPKQPGDLGQREFAVRHARDCKPADAPVREPKTDARRQELAHRTAVQVREEMVDRLAQSTRARVVVALYDDGHATCYRTEIPGEDLAHELITEANRIRRTAAKGGKQ